VAVRAAHFWQDATDLARNEGGIGTRVPGSDAESVAPETAIVGCAHLDPAEWVGAVADIHLPGAGGARRHCGGLVAGPHGPGVAGRGVGLHPAPDHRS
jgi:hypothetical protein